MPSALLHRRMQAGAPGTGKTTFIQNLASAYSHDDCAALPSSASSGGALSPASSAAARRGASPLQRSQGGAPEQHLLDAFSTEPTGLEEFREEPDALCTRVLWSDDTAKINYTLLIQARAVFSHSACTDLHAPVQPAHRADTHLHAPVRPQRMEGWALHAVTWF
jgi:hypothetical protein